MESVNIYADKAAADRVLARITGVPTAIRNIFNGDPSIVSVHVRSAINDMAATFERNPMLGIIETYRRKAPHQVILRGGAQDRISHHAWAYTKDGSCNTRIDLCYDEVQDMV